jgi:MarR family transcriptional regulator, organic hydroperoxide resistance regulator
VTRPDVRTPEAEPDPALGEVLDFMRGIWALDHAVQRTSKRMERELGITGLQRLVIRVVGRFPSIPAGRLAELLHVHPSTLTGVFRRLERQGALRRSPDPRDKRRALLGLTRKGRALDVEREGTIEAAIQQVLRRTDPQTLEAARSLLRKITQMLDERNCATRAARRGGKPR